jgi:hypothetical protein
MPKHVAWGTLTSFGLLTVLVMGQRYMALVVG